MFVTSGLSRYLFLFFFGRNLHHKNISYKYRTRRERKHLLLGLGLRLTRKKDRINFVEHYVKQIIFDWPSKRENFVDFLEVFSRNRNLRAPACLRPDTSSTLYLENDRMIEEDAMGIPRKKV